MLPILETSTNQWESLQDHLLPEGRRDEQAAFLYCTFVQDEEGACLRMRAKESWFLHAEDFSAQYGDFIELKSETRQKVIKEAHTTGTCLAEFHSHPGPWPAAFSPSDRSGLKETVEHMRWRLKGRPYIAVVVAPSGFDALIWQQDSAAPTTLAGIDVNGKRIIPTNISLGDWHGRTPQSL